MYRWLPLIAGCGFQLGPGAAIDDAAVADARLIDAAIDGPATDGPLIDGPMIDGPMIDAPMIDAMIDGPVVPPFCNAADPTLRGCYRFENTLTDGSAYSNGGGGGAAYVIGAGHVGAALNAAISTVTVPVDTTLNLQQFTVKLWAFALTLPASAVARMGLIENDQLRIFVQMGGQLRCAINDGSAEVFSTVNVAINTWTRIACTYGAAGLKIYVNGVDVGTFNTQVALVPLMTGTTIGRQEPSGDTFNGLIDDVQIFSTVVAP